MTHLLLSGTPLDSPQEKPHPLIALGTLTPSPHTHTHTHYCNVDQGGWGKLPLLLMMLLRPLSLVLDMYSLTHTHLHSLTLTHTHSGHGEATSSIAWLPGQTSSLAAGMGNRFLRIFDTRGGLLSLSLSLFFFFFQSLLRCMHIYTTRGPHTISHCSYMLHYHID